MAYLVLNALKKKQTAGNREKRWNKENLTVRLRNYQRIYESAKIGRWTEAESKGRNGLTVKRLKRKTAADTLWKRNAVTWSTKRTFERHENKRI